VLKHPFELNCLSQEGYETKLIYFYLFIYFFVFVFVFVFVLFLFVFFLFHIIYYPFLLVVTFNKRTEIM